MNTNYSNSITMRTGAQFPEVYLDEAEFCARYNLGRRTAQRWRLTGDGPLFVRCGPRRIAYRLSDCEAWAAHRTFAHRAQELASKVNSTSEVTVH